MSEVPDIVRPGLRVWFCGINPGLRSAELGQHFARPGNRFWKVLHLSGFTDRLLAPSEQWSLLDFGLGVTNLVARPSAAAAELSRQELEAGAIELTAKVVELRPRWVAFVGMQAYRSAFRRPKAGVGRQPEAIGGRGIWVLPNPSGLQAHYQLPEMVALFAELREEAL
jgi:double-stranded uracil-DNA glycosylase